MVCPFGICVYADNLLLLLVQSRSTSVDLSEVRKLKEVAFLSGGSSPQWIIKALQTITLNHRNLQRVSLCTPYLPHNPHSTIDCPNIKHAYGETTYRQWSELDNLLTQLWESHSIRPGVMYHERQDGTGRCCARSFLPEATRRGIVDLVKLS